VSGLGFNCVALYCPCDYLCRWQLIRLPEQHVTSSGNCLVKTYFRLFYSAILWIGVSAVSNGTNVYNASVSIYESVPIFASVLTYGLGWTFAYCLLPNCKITKCVMSEAYSTPYILYILDPCCRIWRPQQGNPGLRDAVSACGSMVGLASLEQLEADRLAWSCLPLLPALPFYQSKTHPKFCPRFPANPTGKSSSTSHLRPAHCHAVVSPRSRPISLR